MVRLVELGDNCGWGGPALVPRGQQRTQWNVATAAGPGQQPFLGSIIARLLHEQPPNHPKKPDVGTLVVKPL